MATLYAVTCIDHGLVADEREYAYDVQPFALCRSLDAARARIAGAIAEDVAEFRSELEEGEADPYQDAPTAAEVELELHVDGGWRYECEQFNELYVVTALELEG